MAMVVACSNADAFVCIADGQCGVDGACEASGYCSFPDPDCTSGRRYGALAGSLSGACVDPGAETEQVTTTTTGGRGSTGTGPPPDPDGGSSAPTTTTNTTDGTTTEVGGCPPSTEWWDCDWSGRIALEVAPTTSPRPLLQVPIALFLDASRIDYGLTGPDGQDLRVIASDGLTELPIEIERWDEDGSSVVWFAMESVEPVDPMTVWLYFGSPGARSAGTSAQVWDDNYRAVWHLHQSGFPESTGNASSCSPAGKGINAGPGVFGVGLMPSFGGWATCDPMGLEALFFQSGTVTVWINPTDEGGNSAGRIIDKSTSTSPEGYNIAVNENERIHFARGHEMALGRWRTPNGSVPYGQWSHLAVRFTEGNAVVEPDIFVNGASQTLVVASAPLGAAINEDGLPLAIGNFAPDGTRTFNGVIDELRLSNGFRSTSWIQYQDAVGRDAVISYGEIEYLR